MSLDTTTKIERPLATPVDLSARGAQHLLTAKPHRFLVPRAMVSRPWIKRATPLNPCVMYVREPHHTLFDDDGPLYIYEANAPDGYSHYTFTDAPHMQNHVSRMYYVVTHASEFVWPLTRDGYEALGVYQVGMRCWKIGKNGDVCYDLAGQALKHIIKSMWGNAGDFVFIEGEFRLGNFSEEFRELENAVNVKNELLSVSGHVNTIGR